MRHLTHLGEIMNHDAQFTDEVLEETPVRAAKLLSGLAANPVARTRMSEAGMTGKEILIGQELLMACLSAPLPPIALAVTADSKASQSALLEIDEWDGPHFVRLHSILTRGHIPVRDFIFRDLKAETGAKAVTSVATFCSRFRVLQQKTPVSPDVTVEMAQAALVRLGERGYTDAEISRLEQLVATALGPTQTLPPDDSGAVAQKRREVLTELKLWYDEWADTARTVIKRRDYLIRLGLAYRKKNSSVATDAAD